MWRLGGWQAAWAGGDRARRDFPGLPATAAFREAAVDRVAAADRAAFCRASRGSAGVAASAVDWPNQEPRNEPASDPPSDGSDLHVPGSATQITAPTTAPDPEPMKRRDRKGLRRILLGGARALASATIVSAALALAAAGIKAVLPRVVKMSGRRRGRRGEERTAAALPLGGPPVAPTMQPVGPPLPRSLPLPLWPLGPMLPSGSRSGLPLGGPLLPTSSVLALAYEAMRMGLPASCSL